MAVPRFLLAAPFLALSILAFILMDIPSLIRDFPPPGESGVINWPGGSLPILQKFHYAKFLDVVMRDITVGFAPSTLGYDDQSRWQMIGFLNDCGPPTLFSQIAQIGGGGVVVPLFFFFHVLTSSPETHARRGPSRRTNLRDSWLYLPLVLAFHSVPVYLMYFAPTLETRHYWTWFWQLFPVRISLGYHAVLAVMAITGLSFRPFVPGFRYITALISILAPFIVISAGMYLFTLVKAPYTLTQIFIPSTYDDVVKHDWVLRMRRILQWDEIIIFGSGLLWLAWKAGWDRMRPARLGLSAAAVLVFGPGAGFALLWLAIERGSANEEKEKKAKDKGRAR
ncbi:hypothetical protein EJ04DRAFT_445388 [Polyplosphaeria fusca]|uniref:Uncharacterized protein n=1 Tax=Polyplosphaeria fusca TaxID=682080 RepID=A0A9P4QPH5_9PLEO|nr:hypothetical protein EJ04DRAFT_445388 [Polyplosphaeria fusca]